MPDTCAKLGLVPSVTPRFLISLSWNMFQLGTISKILVWTLARLRFIVKDLHCAGLRVSITHCTIPIRCSRDEQLAFFRALAQLRRVNMYGVVSPLTSYTDTHQMVLHWRGLKLLSYTALGSHS